MGKPRRSLNANVPWQGLLGELGVTVRSQGLPGVVRCPICKHGVLQVSEDRVAGGQWHHCYECRSSGDMIELAAKTWGVDVESAVVRLASAGFDLPRDADAIHAYVRQHVRYRERLASLWKQSQQGLLPGIGTFLRLVHELKLGCNVSDKRWRDGPTGLPGGIDTITVERTLAPGAMKQADACHQKANPSSNATFRGQGWDDVLVMPAYDLPERICGFMFIGRDGDPEKDFIFRRANLGTSANQHTAEPFEAGLSMHPQALKMAEDWDQTVFALDDPLVALRLQMRHFEQSTRPLPVAVWYDSDARPLGQRNGQRLRTMNAWAMMGTRKLVFWSPRLDAAAIRQAAHVDGLISTVGPRNPKEESLKDFVWKYSPRDLLRHIQKSARPWHEVLAEQMATMTDWDVEQLFLRLQTDGEDREDILRRCGQTVRQRVARIFADRQAERTIVLDGRRISERRDGWYVLDGKPKRPE